MARRLRVVQRRLDELIRGPGAVRRILSLCAGDGRDVLPVLAGQPAERRPGAVLVELDPDLAAAAERRAAELGVAATVVVGDAGRARTWQHVVPVDLLMLCGVFGNISDADVQSSIEAARVMVEGGGSVIWTRGHFGDEDEDPRPQIRRWFAEAGFQEIGFDAEPAGYGVGVARLVSGTPAATIPPRLFSFVR